jgi:hypothetical protein
LSSRRFRAAGTRASKGAYGRILSWAASHWLGEIEMRVEIVRMLDSAWRLLLCDDASRNDTELLSDVCPEQQYRRIDLREVLRRCVIDKLEGMDWKLALALPNMRHSSTPQ